MAEDEAAAAAAAAAAGGGGKAKKMKKPTLKQLMMNRGSGIAQYGADIIHHVVLHAGLKPSMKVSRWTTPRRAAPRRAAPARCAPAR